MCIERDDDPRVAAAMAQGNHDVIAAVQSQVRCVAGSVDVDDPQYDPRVAATVAGAKAWGFL